MLEVPENLEKMGVWDLLDLAVKKMAARYPSGLLNPSIDYRYYKKAILGSFDDSGMLVEERKRRLLGYLLNDDLIVGLYDP